MITYIPKAKTSNAHYCVDSSDDISYSHLNGVCTINTLYGGTVNLKENCQKTIDGCEDYAKMNISPETYYAQFAVAGNFIGFSVLFLVLFSAIIIARK